MLSPPTAAEGGSTLPVAPAILLFIVEERPHGWATVYRGTVASAGSPEDLATLEDAMPVLLLEYLLLGGRCRSASSRSSSHCCLERRGFCSSSIHESSLALPSLKAFCESISAGP
jgi:hypothetical protein